jgi:hypothetical protein
VRSPQQAQRPMAATAWFLFAAITAANLWLLLQTFGLA